MIHPRYYGIVFLYLILILTIIVASRFSNQTFRDIRQQHHNTAIAFVLTVILALWIGFRPSLWGYTFFGDSYLYNHQYNLLKNTYSAEGLLRDTSEWIWNNFIRISAHTISIEYFFTIVSFGYFIFSFLACRTLTSNNVLVSLLFLMGSFSFYSYGVNGIRNGLACSIVLYVIALMANDNRRWYLALLLGYVAFNIHRSSVLPLAALVASVYAIKSFKNAYTIWILSIVISLVAGGAISNLFMSLGFDDRMTTYAMGLDNQYTKTGFRWDFLIYSMMPILLGYYIVIKRGIQDRAYLILLNTYTLANAFWVMVIRANYSNRFAYLSWFMYPLVLAYPLLKLDIWGDEQGKYLKQIMLAHVGFTWFMDTFYW